MPVSLFYFYKDISAVEELYDHLQKLGSQLELAGRIRISSEGINGTFGGTTEQVNEFHKAVLRLLDYPRIDFKVSEGSAANFPEGWKVRICRELVTMGVPPAEASWKDAAPHLDATDFRLEVLKELKDPSRKTVVLDVRNQYEHAIGRFKGALLPPIRQFSDFPAFVRRNADVLRNKRVLMYCTGGIRCERASAFLQQEGIASSVAQLRGGIDRFLARYPCGGDAFVGKNLVFDTRMALGTTPPKVVGSCIRCKEPWDDYSRNWRCSHCRARVLLCDDSRCSALFYTNGGLCPACQDRAVLETNR